MVVRLEPISNLNSLHQIKVDFTEILADEILLNIFSFLGTIKDLNNCKLLNKKCLRVVQDNSLWSKLLSKILGFGGMKWEKYLGSVGMVPNFPENIREILTSKSPFDSERLIIDDFLLTLIPKSIDDSLFTLDVFDEHLKAPKSGNSTQLLIYPPEINEQPPDFCYESYWVLMSKQVLPSSIGMSVSEQKVLVESLGFQIPTHFEAAICIGTSYVSKLETYFELERNCQLTRCTGFGGASLVLGAISENGLCIGNDNKGLGVALLLKL